MCYAGSLGAQLRSDKSDLHVVLACTRPAADSEPAAARGNPVADLRNIRDKLRNLVVVGQVGSATAVARLEAYKPALPSAAQILPRFS